MPLEKKTTYSKYREFNLTGLIISNGCQLFIVKTDTLVIDSLHADYFALFSSILLLYEHPLLLDLGFVIA